MGLIRVPRGIQTRRGYAPADIARSAAESAAPWLWRGLSELVLCTESRQPIDVYRRATNWGSFSGNVVSTFSDTGRELYFDGGDDSVWSQTPYRDEKASYFTSTVTAIISRRDANFGVFAGTADNQSLYIFALAANGDEVNTVSGAAGFQLREETGSQLRGYAGSGAMPLGVSSIVTYLVDATNGSMRIFINSVEYSVTFSSSNSLVSGSGKPEMALAFGARNKNAPNREYNGGVQLFMRHGGVLLSDAAVKEIHSDWFAAVRRRPLLIPVSSAATDPFTTPLTTGTANGAGQTLEFSTGVGSQGITLAGGTFNIVPNSDFTMSGRRPLGEDTWDPNDPGTIAVVQEAASVNEDDGTITLSATRSGGTGAASVDWATQDGTATAGTDYTADSNTLNWDDLETGTRSAVISIIDRDGVAQGNLDFTWQLSNATGAAMRSDGGELLDSTTVTINDQDTAGGSVNILVNGDFSTGDYSQWPKSSDPDTPQMAHVPPYGRPPEFGGNGDLAEIVTSPQRGHSSYSSRWTVKNGANWTEPDDCHPWACSEGKRATRTNGRFMYGLQVMPQFSSWWWTLSVFVPNDWDPQPEGRRPTITGIKPANDGASGIGGLGLDPSGWQFVHRHDPEGTPDGGVSLDWWLQMRYNSDTGIDDGGYDALEVDFPDPAASRAAFASINKGGWTDWMYHVHPDWRDPGSVTNNGFFHVYKREDNGPVIHVCNIQPLASLTIGSHTFPRGIGMNSDFYWPSSVGLYSDTPTFEFAANNQTLYYTNTRVHDGGDIITDIADYMLGL